MKNNLHTVLATHEEPQETAWGPWPGDDFLGVALPCRGARGLWVKVEYGEKSVVAQVRDLGPWFIRDDAYVFGTERPKAEKIKGHACTTEDGDVPTIPDGHGGMKEVPVCNGAAIDLFPAVAKALGIPLGENVVVAWRFVEMC